MKMKRIILNISIGLLSMTSFQIGFAQNSVIINTGTPGSPASHNAGPLYRSSASSSFDVSRYSYLFTASELAAAGLTNGDVIQSLGWRKANNATVSPGAEVRIYMKNSTQNAYANATELWANLLAGTTLVYDNTNFSLPSTMSPTFIPFVLNSPFTYTGDALEVLVEFDVMAIPGNPSSGALQWEWNTVPDRIYGRAQADFSAAMNTVSSTTNATTTLDDRRPLTEITYFNGTACAGMPNGGVLNVSNNLVCPTENVSFYVTGSSANLGLTYQWQSSTNGVVWNDIPGATLGSYSTTLSSALNFRRLTICSATNDTAFSSTEFVDVSPHFTCYCSSNATSNSYGDIITLSFSGITTPVSTVCQPYTDNTAITFTGIKNVPMPFSALIDVCSGSSTTIYHTKVYIDLNQNGSYDDAGEVVFYQTSNLGTTLNGNITIPSSALNGTTGMRVVTTTTVAATACGTYTYGETEDYLINIVPQPADEVALLSIDSPTITQCAFGNSIDITLKNHGLNTITSLEFDLILSGLPMNNIAWTGSIAPDSVLSISIPGIYTFNDGDSLHVTVKNPNGNPDNNFDNTKKIQHNIGLNGAYSVGYGVTDLQNKLIADLATAIQLAYSKGVCNDTVYFNLKDSVYNASQFQLIGDYLGYAPGRMIILQSESKDANNLSVNFAATGTANNFIVTLDATNGWGFKHITFNPTGTTYRKVFDIIGGTSNIWIDSCAFVSNQGETGTYSINSAAISVPSGSKSHNIKVHNSYFQDFSIGLRSYGASAEPLQGHELIGNTFRNMHSVVFYGYYLQNPLVLNNDIIMDTIPGGPTTQYTFYLSYVKGANFSGNSIQANQAQHTFYLSGNNSSSIEDFLISNNFIYNSLSASTGNVSALYSTSATNMGIKFVNNSLHFRSDNLTYATIYLTNGVGFTIYNNNIVSAGNLRIYNITNLGTIDDANYNNLYSLNTTGYIYVGGSNYASLSDWYNASGFDGNSMSLDPLFNGADLHTCLQDLDGAAIPFPGVTHDFDGNMRNSSKPDIGADEFIGSAIGIIAEEMVEKCENNATSIGAASMNNVTYLWSPTNETQSQINVTNPGIYTLTVTSACGSFTDTIEVVNYPAAVADFSLANSYGLAALLTNTSSNGLSYHWDFGDGATSTDMNPHHQYTTDGQYTITLTVYGLCDTVTTTQVYDAVALDNEEILFQELSLYPNPATDVLNLQIPNANTELFQMDILDITGKVLSVHKNVSGSNHSVDVHMLQPGVYQLKITSNNGSKTLPFVKK